MVIAVYPKNRSAIETSTSYADMSKEHSPVSVLNVSTILKQPAVVYSISQSRSEETIDGIIENVPVYE